MKKGLSTAEYLEEARRKEKKLQIRAMLETDPEKRSKLLKEKEKTEKLHANLERIWNKGMEKSMLSY